MLPSVKVPVAVNWSLVPLGIELLGAVIVMDCSVGAVTLSVKEFDVIPVWEAVMLVEPVLTAVARPLALILATAELDEAHVAEVVRFCVLPSVNVPVAVN